MNILQMFQDFVVSDRDTLHVFHGYVVSHIMIHSTHVKVSWHRTYKYISYISRFYGVRHTDTLFIFQGFIVSDIQIHSI